MPLPRNVLVNEQLTPYYHCISRCVRRAYLCGRDPLTRKNFNHRKAWVVRRLRQLSDIFAIDVCGYVIMSNHLHLVLRIHSERARQWSEQKVMRMWQRLYPHSAKRAQRLPAAERERLVAEWRARLSSLSWFMRCLNEHIARRANREDRCTGRFWEGRFRSQALMDPGALLTCLSYVDLNPVRAGLAKTLREARFTSIHTRMRYARRRRGCPWLVPFEGEGLEFFARHGPPAHAASAMLPMRFEEYVALLEQTAAAIHAKRTELSGPAALTLARIGLTPSGFMEAVVSFSRSFFTMAGEVHRIRVEVERRGLRRCRGAPAALRLYAQGTPVPNVYAVG